MNITAKLRRADRLLQQDCADRALDILNPVWAHLTASAAEFPPCGVLFCAALDRLSAPAQQTYFSSAARQILPNHACPETGLFMALLPHCSTEQIQMLYTLLPEPPSIAQLQEAADRDMASDLPRRAAGIYRAAAALAQPYAPDLYSSLHVRLAAVLYLAGLRKEAADVYVEGGFPEEPADLPDSLRGCVPLLQTEALLAENKPEQALSQLQTTLQTMPGSILLQTGLAHALEAAGQWPQAAQQWEHLAENDPDHAALHLQNAGHALRSSHRFEEATLCYRRARSANASDSLCAELWIAEGLCEYALKNSDRELAAYQQALSLLGSDEPAACIRPLCYCADTEYRTGDIPAGSAHYARALHLAQREKQTHRAVQIQCEWADHIREYAKDFCTAIQYYTKAIRQYRRLLRTHPDACRSLAITYNSRGICCYHLKKYNGQISDTTAAITILRALEQSSDNLVQLSACLRNRGDSWEQLQKYPAAIEDYLESVTVYQQAIEKDPTLNATGELSELLLCCGRVSDRMERYDESIIYYGEILLMMDSRPELSVNEREYAALAALRRGSAYVQSRIHSFSNALSDYDSAIALTTHEPTLQYICLSAYRQQGDLYAAMNQYDRSAQCFAEAERIRNELVVSEAAT